LLISLNEKGTARGEKGGKGGSGSKVAFLGGGREGASSGQRPGHLGFFKRVRTWIRDKLGGEKEPESRRENIRLQGTPEKLNFRGVFLGVSL